MTMKSSVEARVDAIEGSLQALHNKLRSRTGLRARLRATTTCRRWTWTRVAVLCPPQRRAAVATRVAPNFLPHRLSRASAAALVAAPMNFVRHS